uniref:Elongin A, like n=1 Tax=Cyprinus carpio TaxID=7962 RepID=A0A8C1XQF7_CYPCA
VVNSFRKHDEAGKVAKILVNRWKALVPRDSIRYQLVHPVTNLSSGGKPDDYVQESSKHENSQLSETANSRKKPKIENTSTEKKMSQNVDIKCKIKPSKSKIHFNGEKKGEPKKDSSVNQGSGHAKEKTSGERTKHDSKKTDKASGITKNQENTKREKSLKRPEATQKQREKSGDACKKEKMEKATDKAVAMETLDGCQTPSMSFEAYLSYDLEPPKRKKSFSVAKNPKRLKTAHKESSAVSLVKTSEAVTEDPVRTAYRKTCVCCLWLFFSNPLKKIVLEKKGGSELSDRKVIDVCEEAPVIIGQRLKNKMQVYSGSKMAYLPTMMTLYQQCIRALQNNIDSLYEIGGVPFEILEPVLERCTPEQLLRIEECNPVYIGVTDHLWERHCQKDFRNAQLEEYESWREMYLRMSKERERKLKQITKSIVSAHSGKPKGRQVKMAFIHSAAKPPRNVRIQQEIHGTAGPVTLPHPTDRARSVQTRLGWKVAPMMAKSLKAFKKQLSRR